MPEKRIWLYPPHLEEHEEKLTASKKYKLQDQQVDAFENEVAEYLGVKGAVAMNSEAAALQLALRLLKVGINDRVFCSTFASGIAAHSIVYQKARPVFIDSEPHSWNMSPLALERAFADAAKEGKLPKAVIVVHLYGQCADMELILQICDKYHTPVIEDASESLGATYLGKAGGVWGRFGIYSFNENRIITALGGGMLVSDDQRAIDLARHLAAPMQAAGKQLQSHNQTWTNGLQAGIGRSQLRVLEQRIDARREIFFHYEEQLSHIEGIHFIPEMYYGRSTRWLTALTLDPLISNVSPDHILQLMSADGIEVSRVYKPLHLQPFFMNSPYYQHRMQESVAERIYQTGICLPSGPNLTNEDQTRVVESVRSCYKSKTAALS